ncbi:hypothetical protein VIGAN_09124600 [Vigna angularis var. angularis]|uniref:Uncharacterized protein n=1 Tax=Vigna angularis var. angularis TaxID=157739 RepID=A0A0S3SXS0_PHAAN|nr:hypothetical protein VIGAN_09124600 [Vigna angularis var. angularis]
MAQGRSEAAGPAACGGNRREVQQRPAHIQGETRLGERGQQHTAHTWCIQQAASAHVKEVAKRRSTSSSVQATHGLYVLLTEMAHESLHVQHAGSRLEQQQHTLGLGEAAVADSEKWNDNSSKTAQHSSLRSSKL